MRGMLRHEPDPSAVGKEPHMPAGEEPGRVDASGLSGSGGNEENLRVRSDAGEHELSVRRKRSRVAVGQPFWRRTVGPPQIHPAQAALTLVVKEKGVAARSQTTASERSRWERFRGRVSPGKSPRISELSERRPRSTRPSAEMSWRTKSPGSVVTRLFARPGTTAKSSVVPPATELNQISFVARHHAVSRARSWRSRTRPPGSVT